MFTRIVLFVILVTAVFLAVYANGFVGGILVAGAVYGVVINEIEQYKKTLPPSV